MEADISILFFISFHVNPSLYAAVLFYIKGYRGFIVWSGGESCDNLRLHVSFHGISAKLWGI